MKNIILGVDAGINAICTLLPAMSNSPPLKMRDFLLETAFKLTTGELKSAAFITFVADGGQVVFVIADTKEEQVSLLEKLAEHLASNAPEQSLDRPSAEVILFPIQPRKGT